MVSPKRRHTKIFLSYGRLDAKALAGRLETDLKHVGFDVWRDVSALRSAGGWDAQIEQAIATSDILLAILTPHATRRSSDQKGATHDSACLDEIAFARFGPKPVPIVPIMAVQTELPLLLIRQQWLDFRAVAGSTAEYSARFATLVDLIESVTHSGHAPEIVNGYPDVFSLDNLIPYHRSDFVGRNWMERRLLTWTRRPSSKHMLLITGDPGIGKSTFFADIVSKNPGGHVIAYHACRQTRRDTLQPGKAIRSMATMLSRLFPSSLALFEDLIKNDGPLSLGEALSNPQRSFDEGLLGLIPPDILSTPRIIFVDALDEAISISPDLTIVDIIARALDLLPKGLRVIATSRNDPTVLALFSDSKISSIDAQSKRNMHDVTAYIKRRLINARLHVPIHDLVRRVEALAAGNFLVAKLICDEVEDTGRMPGGGRGAPAKLGGEYTRAFRRIFRDLRGYERARKVLAISVAAFAPIPVNIVAEAVSASNKRELLESVKPVASYILRSDDTVAPFHLSFSEWLQDSSNEFGVDLQPAHRAIVLAFSRRVAAGVRGIVRMSEPDKEYFGRYLLDHLAEGSEFIDPEIPYEVFVALDLGMYWRGGTTRWPNTETHLRQLGRPSSCESRRFPRVEGGSSSKCSATQSIDFA